MMSDVRHQTSDRGEVRVNAVLRDRRQVTIPRAVCEELGVRPGDRLELRVEDGTLIVRPGRGAGLGGVRGLPPAPAGSGRGSGGDTGHPAGAGRGRGYRGGATGERPPDTRRALPREVPGPGREVWCLRTPHGSSSTPTSCSRDFAHLEASRIAFWRRPQPETYRLWCPGACWWSYSGTCGARHLRG